MCYDSRRAIQGIEENRLAILGHNWRQNLQLGGPWDFRERLVIMEIWMPLLNTFLRTLVPLLIHIRGMYILNPNVNVVSRVSRAIGMFLHVTIVEIVWFPFTNYVCIRGFGQVCRILTNDSGQRQVRIEEINEDNKIHDSEEPQSQDNNEIVQY
ncbi:unnamed protein product [Cochlearia groenlandica]